MIYIIFWLVGFTASVIGAICGMGGGIIIKPVLDAFGILSAAEISFLSGCTVLVMTLYSVIRSKISDDSVINVRLGTFLAIGSVVGGILGKQIFQRMVELLRSSHAITVIQAIILGTITLGAFLYMLNKERIHTYNVSRPSASILIGLVLGGISSFLGIGGGPINLIILYFLFSMTTKAAVQNSLYIIAFSQIASLITTGITGMVPKIEWVLLAGMGVCGIAGGICGGYFNKKLRNQTIEQLFRIVMIGIILINIYNIFRLL